MRHRITVMLLLAALTAPVGADPVFDRPLTITQPDGSTFSGRMTGDELLRLFRTESGYTVMRGSDGWWRYALPAMDGNIGPDGPVVTADDPVWLPFEKNLTPDTATLQRWQVRHRTIRADAERARHEAFSAARQTGGARGLSETGDLGPKMNGPLSGQYRLLVVLVDFPEDSTVAHAWSADQVREHLFSNRTRATGSAADFFEESSYGHFSITGDVVGWITAPQSQRYYANNESGMGTSYPRNSRGLVVHLIQAIDAQVDFNQYDNDHNGTVDGLAIIFKGYANGDVNRLWPHAWALNDFRMQADGVTVNPYFMSGELAANGQLEAIGTFVHEYSHVLGMPDLYDYDSGSFQTADSDDHPIQSWCLMASGNYGYGLDNMEGSGPSHHIGFCRWYWGGWAQPTLIASSGQYAIAAIGTNAGQSLYRININSAGTEYFLIENRTPVEEQLFDRNDSDGIEKDHGLIITHVDEALLEETADSFFNDGTPTRSHYGIALLDAGQPANLTVYPHETRKDAAYSAEDFQTQVTPVTSPVNTAGYIAPSGISIRDISASGPVMTFTVDMNGSTAGTAPLRTALTLNRASYRIGDTHTLTLHAQRSASESGLFDLYAGLLLPDGTLVCLNTANAFGAPNAIMPWRQSWTAGTALSQETVFSIVLPEGLPLGVTYHWAFVAMQAGGNIFSDAPVAVSLVPWTAR